jgi:hypothetical protein
MTREMVIEDLKRCVYQRDNYLNAVSVPNTDAMKKAIELLEQCKEEEPTDDIPIGAPCEVWDDGGKNKKLRYYVGNGGCVIFRDEICGRGVVFDHIKPIGIWDIPEKYGGAPVRAIARAYNSSTTIWISDEIYFAAYESVGYTIERRPEEE